MTTPTTKAGRAVVERDTGTPNPLTQAEIEALTVMVAAIEDEARAAERERIVSLYCTCSEGRHRSTWKHCRAYDLVAILDAPEER